MREIKFRAQTKDGIWKYGMLTYANFNKGVERAIAVKTELGSILLERVDDSTIGQFTGLYDKNGKEIYEGDIIKGTIVSAWVKAIISCEVKWDRDGWVCVEIDRYKDTEHKVLFGKDCEVIGNIHDNPKLIKE